MLKAQNLYTLLIVFLLLLDTTYAQINFEKIDYKNIQKQISDPDLPTYYPQLLSRYENFDPELTNADFRLIYYVFAFNKKYTGFSSEKSKEINDFLKLKKYQDAIVTCDSVLSETPISLRANYLKGYALFKKDSSDTLAVKLLERHQKLMNAIVSSGDGLKCKSGFAVLFISDEYEIIYKYFEIEKFMGQSLQTPCDILTIEPNSKFKQSSVYFDASKIIEKEMEMFNGNK
ncbi:MAG: DUF4919 domain-containing protein [Bacteroidota bacterium]